MNGYGECYYKDGKKYFGFHKMDKEIGFGVFCWNNNKYYEGSWDNNKQHGEGFYYLNGKTLKGQFRYGKIITKNDD